MIEETKLKKLSVLLSLIWMSWLDFWILSKTRLISQTANLLNLITDSQTLKRRMKNLRLTLSSTKLVNHTQKRFLRKMNFRKPWQPSKRRFLKFLKILLQKDGLRSPMTLKMLINKYRELYPTSMVSKLELMKKHKLSKVWNRSTKRKKEFTMNVEMNRVKDKMRSTNLKKKQQTSKTKWKKFESNSMTLRYLKIHQLLLQSND